MEEISTGAELMPFTRLTSELVEVKETGVGTRLLWMRALRGTATETVPSLPSEIGI